MVDDHLATSYYKKMKGWIWITKELLKDGREVMIMPAMFNKPVSNTKRVFRFTCDAVYYIIRWYAL